MLRLRGESVKFSSDEDGRIYSALPGSTALYRSQVEAADSSSLRY
jgi:hypothetical protein